MLEPFEIAGEIAAAGSGEEALVELQALLDEVVNGRTSGHACPWCRKGPLACAVTAGVVQVTCPDCGKTFEGRLA